MVAGMGAVSLGGMQWDRKRLPRGHKTPVLEVDEADVLVGKVQLNHLKRQEPKGVGVWQVQCNLASYPTFWYREGTGGLRPALRVTFWEHVEHKDAMGRWVVSIGAHVCVTPKDPNDLSAGWLSINQHNAYINYLNDFQHKLSVDQTSAGMQLFGEVLSTKNNLDKVKLMLHQATKAYSDLVKTVKENGSELSDERVNSDVRIAVEPRARALYGESNTEIHHVNCKRPTGPFAEQEDEASEWSE